jgi:hypothetical protein
MDAEIINRLRSWFYLRLAPEDWSKFGSSASQVLQTFDNDPDQEDALLRFAEVVVLLEIQRLKNPLRVVKLARKRALELKRLGLTREQLIKVSGFDSLVGDGYFEVACDAEGQPIYRNGEPVYTLSEKGRKLTASGLPPQEQELP